MVQNRFLPMRVVLATVGSRGDIQPMLALAQALAARGHAPLVAAPPNFASWVQGLGLDFVPLGVDIQEYLAQRRSAFTGDPLRMLRTTREYFVEQVPGQMAQLEPVCRGADVLVFAGLALAAPSIAERLRLPVLGVLFTTCVLPAGAHPPPIVPWHGLPRWINRLLWGLDHLLANALARSTLSAARAGIGLGPVSDLRKHLFDACRFVLAVDETLFPSDPDWQERFPYANYLYFDDPAPLDPGLEAWLGEGEPPLFLGFGSMSGEAAERAGHVAIEALAGSGRRCLVSAGWAGLGARDLPPGWRAVRDAPHALLFPRCAAIVHHGGSGTLASALRAGVPQVILPLILDQFHHAHRLHLAGIAPRPVPMERITAMQLRAAIEAALALPESPRREAAERLRSSDGRGEIARRIEQLAAADLAPRNDASPS